MLTRHSAADTATSLLPSTGGGGVRDRDEFKMWVKGCSRIKHFKKLILS